MSEFLNWFVNQHGKRECGVMARYSDQRLRDEIERGKIAAAALEKRLMWDEKHQSALYAWQARSR